MNGEVCEQFVKAMKLRHRPRKFFPKWIRLKDGAQEILHKEYLKAYDSTASENWIWFIDIIDFQETCNRTSHLQTLKSRTIRFLIWLAEKVAKL